MKKIKQSLLVLGIILTGGILIYATSDQIFKQQIKQGNRSVFPVNAEFAGEPVPLQITDVRERFDRELIVNTNLHGSTILILKRANRVFPIIEPILRKNGIPDDFKYLAVIESALVNAVSPSGAKGVWQFMPETAKEQGMEVNDNVDERYHLVKSTEAACKFLLEAKNRLGSWTLAAASYNGGTNGVSKQIEAQKVSNYYDLLLTEETSRYVFRILALKEIMKKPDLYGFNVQPEGLYENLPTKKLEVDSTITNLADFALKQGINYKILKIHNPWLRDKKLENKNKKSYQIEIPLKGY